MRYITDQTWDRFSDAVLIVDTETRRVWKAYAHDGREESAYFVHRGWRETWGFRVASQGWAYDLQDALS
jgi:hypothetical protein